MDAQMVEFIDSALRASGLFGLCAILIYLLHKTLPNFSKSLEKKSDENTKAITGAIEKQTNSTKEAYSELKESIHENTHAINSLREHRRDDVQKIEEILDHVKGTYRMMQENRVSNGDRK